MTARTGKVRKGITRTRLSPLSNPLSIPSFHPLSIPSSTFPLSSSILPSLYLCFPFLIPLFLLPLSLPRPSMYPSPSLYPLNKIPYCWNFMHFLDINRYLNENFWFFFHIIYRIAIDLLWYQNTRPIKYSPISDYYAHRRMSDFISIFFNMATFMYPFYLWPMGQYKYFLHCTENLQKYKVYTLNLLS